MPTDEVLLQQATDCKTQGNTALGQSAAADAVTAYSQGIVLCDRVVTSAAATPLKAALLSNRAMCHLKTMQLDRCLEDCTTALALDGDISAVRSKLLFRRAKGAFLQASLPEANVDVLLPQAAKDLLQVLQVDPTNKEATKLLPLVRAQHKQRQSATTPVSQTLQALRRSSDNDEAEGLKQIKILLGLVNNDVKNAPAELGRLGGVSHLLALAGAAGGEDNATVRKTALLSLQCLSQAATNPLFVRSYLVDQQAALVTLLQAPTTPDPDWLVSALAIWARIILHADRDDPAQEVSGTSLLDYDALVSSLQLALAQSDTTVLRALMDIIGVWTAGQDREAIVRQALADGSLVDPALAAPKTAEEIRAFTPQALAAHRKREYAKQGRDTTWAQERCQRLVGDPVVFTQVLDRVVQVDDPTVRREMTVTIGRLLAILEEEEDIKAVVKSQLASPTDTDAGVTIETINEDEEQKEGIIEEEVTSLQTMMKRAVITSGLLLAKKEVGAWALSFGWSSSGKELPALVESQDKLAMGLAAEVISAAATVEAARNMVGSMLDSGVMKSLLMSDDRDIRSAAASAVAKLGLSNKATHKDEGEVMGLLQAACDLLEDDRAEETKAETRSKQFHSYATSSVERAIEMINYLIANTIIKEELAAGFQPRHTSTKTSLQRLVQTAGLPSAGVSLTGFALAAIFQNMAVTNMQVRKEGFEGREVTMEQYDEMQKMGKTAEEQEVLDSKQDPDTKDSCNERIRKMAAANVPRAMVSLMEGASEQTLEQLILAMSRMAGETSVRGLMIQQGVLSSLIKLEKEESPTETEMVKKTVRNARHCVAKMLITTNPMVLTSAQRLGAIRPLVQLVRDIKSTDLQQFEALLSITNISSSGEDALNRIVSERGIATLHFAMFSDHDLVRRAATEAMSNLIQHEAMTKHLLEGDNLRIWLSFAADYEEHYECARAASGCLAMATQYRGIAEAIVKLEKFQVDTQSLLESGRLEIMHRTLVFIQNLVLHGEPCKQAVIDSGLVAFCDAYAQSFQTDGGPKLEFTPEEEALLPVTADIAQKIVKSTA
jgi:hypothetical protein